MLVGKELNSLLKSYKDMKISVIDNSQTGTTSTERDATGRHASAADGTGKRGAKSLQMSDSKPPSLLSPNLTEPESISAREFASDALRRVPTSCAVLWIALASWKGRGRTYQDLETILLGFPRRHWTV